MKHRHTENTDPDRWRMPLGFWLWSTLLLIGALAKVAMWACNWLRMASN